MNKIAILDCGPSLEEVSCNYGQSPEWIKTILKDKKCSFNWIKSYNGEVLDDDFNGAIIITGSPKSVYEEDSWMLALEKNIIKSAQKKMKVLGICFGHQLIAKAFGGKVELNPKGWELGSCSINITDRGKESPLFKNMGEKLIVYESHKDCVTVFPQLATELAYNEKCTQSFQICETMFSVQFHPEFTEDIMKKYVSVRMSNGVLPDKSSFSESKLGYLILHNFIDLI